jgi:hypothetical protein
VGGICELAQSNFSLVELVLISELEGKNGKGSIRTSGELGDGGVLKSGSVIGGLPCVAH